MVDPQISITRRLTWSLTALVTVMLGGALGFYIIGGGAKWTPIDALYMSVITVTTVGYGEVHDLGQGGRVFAVFLILCGVGSFTYTITSVGNYLIAGELKGYLGQRRMEKNIEQLSEHFIVCGYGRMGQQVADDLRREKKPYVVVDRSEAAIDLARSNGDLALVGDAGEDDVLRQAGIERARALVTAIDDDAMNVMVVLSARALNDKLFIVARANHEGTESKLATAGANRVLWPYGISGRRLAQMALRPHVVEFLELVMHDEELELLLEEVIVAIGSPLQDCAIGAARIRGDTGATVLALRKRDGKMVVSPSADTVLHAGDIAVVLGTQEQLAKVRKLAYSREAGNA
ncbi:MAG: NAD-binding protein [Phycisphaerae bacterium]|jgi:voltage-gated potassium channel